MTDGSRKHGKKAGEPGAKPEEPVSEREAAERKAAEKPEREAPGEAAGRPPAEEAPGPEAGLEIPALEAKAWEEDPRDAEIARLKDQLLRTLAELENLRRRGEREREDIAKYAIAGFVRDILTVADNVRRALEAIPAHAREEDQNLDSLAVGVEATERELLAAFERHGIRKIEPLGEKFDHDLHHAMFEVENTGKPPGTVVELMQAGYILNDRLLRPAMVGVAKGEPKGEDAGEEGEKPEGVDTTV